MYRYLPAYIYKKNILYYINHASIISQFFTSMKMNKLKQNMQ